MSVIRLILSARIALLLAASILAAIATNAHAIGAEVESTGGQWETMVMKRAQERWNLLVEGRLESAYEYFSPSRKKILPYSDFRKQIKGVGLWKSALVKNATCIQDRCKVATELLIETRYPFVKGPIETTVVIDEAWIIDHENGQVWFVPNK